MGKTIKLKESKLREMIREAIDNAIGGDNIIISRRRMGEGSNVCYGQDKMSYFAADYRANVFRRFPNEQQAFAFAKELYKQEQERIVRDRQGLVNKGV